MVEGGSRNMVVLLVAQLTRQCMFSEWGTKADVGMLANGVLYARQHRTSKTTSEWIRDRCKIVALLGSSLAPNSLIKRRLSNVGALP
jgi:hypothetical protein